MAGVSNAAVAAGVCDDEAAFRIFLRDAERTFQDEGHRQAFMELLKSVWPENRDYHQGLGYVCSLLMLVFDTDTTQAILLQLSRSPKYTPGYWRAAPEPYVRDGDFGFAVDSSLVTDCWGERPLARRIASAPLTCGAAIEVPASRPHALPV